MSDASKIAGLTVGSRVKYSTKFIRSIGSVGNWRAEVVGTVVDLFKVPSYNLALVEWDKDNGFSEVNVANLVEMKRVAREAAEAEHRDHVRGLVIGSNAYLELEPRHALIAASKSEAHHG